MSDYRIAVDARPAITHIHKLRYEQHLQLIADLLDFFQSAPGRLDIRRIGETYADERFTGYPAPFLRSLVKGLTTSGLLAMPPHQRTRATGYITTPMGRAVRELYLKSLAG